MTRKAKVMSANKQAEAEEQAAAAAAATAAAAADGDGGEAEKEDKAGQEEISVDTGATGDDEADDDDEEAEYPEPEIPPPPAFFELEHLRLCKHIFELLTKDHDVMIGKALSKRQRENEKLTAVHLAYSEIRFETFAVVLKKIRSKYNGLLKPGGNFYDLGSGLGKPVFAAAMMHEWGRCTGIEVLDMLHDGARELLDIWDRTKDSLMWLTEGQRQTRIDLVNEDFTAKGFSLADAELVFMNSTCFDEEMLLKIAHKADKMDQDTFLVSHTQRLPSVHWEVLEKLELMQSWGECTVFIHRRRKIDWEAVRAEREELARAQAKKAAAEQAAEDAAAAAEEGKDEASAASPGDAGGKGAGRD